MINLLETRSSLRLCLTDLRNSSGFASLCKNLCSTIYGPTLNNSFILSHIEFVFGMVVSQDNRHQPLTLLLCLLGCHGNQKIPRLLLCLSFIGLIFGTELYWSHTCTMLLLARFHGNHNGTSITSFSYVHNKYKLNTS